MIFNYLYYNYLQDYVFNYLTYKHNGNRCYLTSK
jgi:hypothetical protein